MAGSKEFWEAVKEYRWEVCVELLRHVLPTSNKQPAMTRKKAIEAAVEYYEDHEDEIAGDFPSLIKRSDDFINPNYLNRNWARLRAVSSRDGHFLAEDKRRGQIVGVCMTRDKRKIESTLGRRQSALTTQLEGYNDLAESLNFNPRYPVQLALFHIKLVLPEARKN